MARPTVTPMDAMRLSAARLIATEMQPFMAPALHRVVEVPQPGLGTFAVSPNWHMYFDPECLATWTPHECAGVLLHEVGHLLRDHADRARAVCADHEPWNVAGDLEINDDLVGAGVPMPEGVIVPSMFGFADGDFAESYYAQLPRQQANGGGAAGGRAEGDQPQPGASTPPFADGTCGSGVDGKPRPWDRGDSDVTVSPEEATNIREQVAVAAVAQESQRPGSVPAGMTRWAEKVLGPPRVNWRSALRGSLRKAVRVAQGQGDYTRSKLSRRYQPGGVLQPGLRKPVPNIALVIDTSGSMSGRDLGDAMNEIEGVVRCTGVADKSLHAVAVDAAAATPVPVRSVRSIKLTGGGGTNMCVGIEAAASIKPRPHIVVVLTDGWTPWPATLPKGMQLVVCLVGSHPASVADTKAKCPPRTVVVGTNR